MPKVDNKKFTFKRQLSVTSALVKPMTWETVIFKKRAASVSILRFIISYTNIKITIWKKKG